jgi:hypothetical protein
MFMTSASALVIQNPIRMYTVECILLINMYIQSYAIVYNDFDLFEKIRNL